ncbi:MAG: cyclic pyranopterin monophosphate synthase MoaC [Candidatus Methanomethylicota archaeon]|uniref:Probable cyclic pyranopterin monophosphate synthase n=1 Tax=Thermoproteota archaeon TaxID=2056631 RepID=A0A497F489_9CREN|nr:MAG: cyclic pyranopterin monophosphate synthase MoaC [Candidatus Verstraetearchaeota archaeon]
MVDITEKGSVYREAIASGFIKLKPTTLKLLREGKVEKGDVFSVAQTAAILAAKKTPELIPLCHPIPITNVEVSFVIEEDGVNVTAVVKSVGKTGVEMEALQAVSQALLTIWDMVKKYEKDERGQYPTTVITDIKVLSKVKEGMN